MTNATRDGWAFGNVHPILVLEQIDDKLQAIYSPSDFCFCLLKPLHQPGILIHQLSRLDIRVGFGYDMEEGAVGVGED